MTYYARIDVCVELWNRAARSQLIVFPRKLFIAASVQAVYCFMFSTSRHVYTAAQTTLKYTPERQTPAYDSTVDNCRVSEFCFFKNNTLSIALIGNFFFEKYRRGCITITLNWRYARSSYRVHTSTRKIFHSVFILLK